MGTQQQFSRAVIYEKRQIVAKLYCFMKAIFSAGFSNSNVLGIYINMILYIDEHKTILKLDYINSPIQRK